MFDTLATTLERLNQLTLNTNNYTYNPLGLRGIGKAIFDSTPIGYSASFNGEGFWANTRIPTLPEIKEFLTTLPTRQFVRIDHLNGGDNWSKQFELTESGEFQVFSFDYTTNEKRLLASEVTNLRPAPPPPAEVTIRVSTKKETSAPLISNQPTQVEPINQAIQEALPEVKRTIPVISLPEASSAKVAPIEGYIWGDSTPLPVSNSAQGFNYLYEIIDTQTGDIDWLKTEGRYSLRFKSDGTFEKTEWVYDVYKIEDLEETGFHGPFQRFFLHVPTYKEIGVEFVGEFTTSQLFPQGNPYSGKYLQGTYIKTIDLYGGGQMLIRAFPGIKSSTEPQIGGGKVITPIGEGEVLIELPLDIDSSKGNTQNPEPITQSIAPISLLPFEINAEIQTSNPAPQVKAGEINYEVKLVEDVEILSVDLSGVAPVSTSEINSMDIEFWRRFDSKARENIEPVPAELKIEFAEVEN